MFRLLVIFLVSLVNLSYTQTVYIDCNGKGFFCKNTTSFLICVDTGNGVTQTVDNLIQHCPQGYQCNNNAPYECVRIVSTYPQEYPQQTPTEIQNNGINHLSNLETKIHSESDPVQTFVENVNEETLTTRMTQDPQSITHSTNNNYYQNNLNNSMKDLPMKPFHHNIIEQSNQTDSIPNTESWETGVYNTVHNTHPHNYTYLSLPPNTYSQMTNTTNGYSKNYSNVQYYSDIRNQQPVQTSNQYNSQIFKNNIHPENSLIYSEESNYPDDYQKFIQDQALSPRAGRGRISADVQNIDHKSIWPINSYNSSVSSDFNSSHEFDNTRQIKDVDSPSMIYHEDIFNRTNENVNPLNRLDSAHYPKKYAGEDYDFESVNYMDTPEINLLPNNIHGHFINYTTVITGTNIPSNEENNLSSMNLSPNARFSDSMNIEDDMVNDQPNKAPRQTHQLSDSPQNQPDSPNYQIFEIANPIQAENYMAANTYQKNPADVQSVGTLIHEKIASITEDPIKENSVSDPLKDVKSDKAFEELKQTSNHLSPILEKYSGVLKNDNTNNYLDSMNASDPPVIIKDENYINYSFGLAGVNKSVVDENELVNVTDSPIPDLHKTIKGQIDILDPPQHKQDNFENSLEMVRSSALPNSSSGKDPVDINNYFINISNQTPFDTQLNPAENKTNISYLEIGETGGNIPSEINSPSGFVINSDPLRNLDEENDTLDISYNDPLPYMTNYFSETYYNNTTIIPESNNSKEVIEQPSDIFKVTSATQDKQIMNISLPVNIEGRNINISSLLVHNPLNEEEYSVPAIRNTSNIFKNDTNFTLIDVPQLINITQKYNTLPNQSIEYGISNNIQSELLDTNTTNIKYNTETPSIYSIPNGAETINNLSNGDDLSWKGEPNLPNRERAESNIMSLLVNKPGSLSPNIINTNLTSEDIQVMNLTNVPIEGSEDVLANFENSKLMVQNNISSPDNLSRDEYILGLNLVPNHNDNLVNNSVNPLINIKLDGDANALEDDGKSLPILIENTTEVKNLSFPSDGIEETTINPFAGLIEQIISHDLYNGSFIGDDIKGTDEPKGVLAEYLNPITDNKPDSFVSVKDLVVENNIMSPGDLNHNRPIMGPGNLNNELLVRPSNINGQSLVRPINVNNQALVGPENINNQPLRRPEYNNNEPLIRPDYNNNQPIIETGIINGQPLVRPANFNNQPLVRPGNINSQPLGRPEYNNYPPLVRPANLNNQPLIRPGNINNQPLGKPGYNNNQPLVGPEYNTNQPLIGQGNINSQPLGRPEYSNNQQLVRPGYNNNQQLIGQGNINGQPLERPANNYGTNFNGQIDQVNRIPEDLERKTETSITERNTNINRNPTLSGRVECTVYQSTADISTCHSYYVCKNNQQIRLFCPYNMIYSPILRTCTTEKEHCSSNGDFVCSSPGFYPDPKSCYSYYECEVASNGFKVNKYVCPWYSSFNPEYKQCVEGHSNCVGMNNNNNNYRPPNSPNSEFRSANQNNYQSTNNQDRMRMVGPNEVPTTPRSYIVHQQESSWIPRRVFYWF